MIKYKLVKWVFNAGAWANAAREAQDTVGVDLVADVMQVHRTTVISWGKMKSGYEDFPYPNMTNFIAFCNHFDKDPREFFMLEDL